MITEENFRVIARIDVKNEHLIKGIHFEGLRKIGIPNAFAKKYYQQGIDELFYLDLVASLYNRPFQEQLIRNAAKEIFVPFTVGGGVKSVYDVERLLKCGADKVAINSHALLNPSLLSQAVKEFGSQCVVTSIESKFIKLAFWEAYIFSGREATGVNVLEWICEVQDRGVGEVIITSIDKEGTMKGFDETLLEAVHEKCRVPLVFSGGYSKQDDLNCLMNKRVDGIAIGAAFHFNKANIFSIKKSMADKGYLVRPCHKT